MHLIAAFLRGYLAADGSKRIQRGVEQYVGIFSSCPEAIDFLNKYLPAIGLYVLNQRDEEVETNYGVRKGSLLSLSTCQGLLWTVKEIQDWAYMDCWCLTVEDDHSFVLPNGIVSGNCAFTKIETVHDVVDAFWLLLQGCFSPDPVVKMADGTHKKIQDIVPGDRVMSYDETTKQFRPSTVSKLNENMPKPMVRVTFEDGTSVLCTEDHQFMTDEGWVEAKDLANKDVVSHAKGEPREAEVGGT